MSETNKTPPCSHGLNHDIEESESLGEIGGKCKNCEYSTLKKYTRDENGKVEVQEPTEREARAIGSGMLCEGCGKEDGHCTCCQGCGSNNCVGLCMQ